MPKGYIYSRYTAPTSTRLETVLTSLLNGPTLTYASGLAAFHALLVFLNPKQISIGEGYHGCHGVIGIHQKLTGVKKIALDCPAEDLQPGDIVHIETPINPRGLAFNIEEYAKKAHAQGAYLTVDATFGPPPLQDPFQWGADVVLHSGTKYIGGHSDMLCGTLSVHPDRAKEGWIEKMIFERAYIGGVLGSLEGWLGVRSVRTLEVRVKKQSESATKIVTFFHDALGVNDDKADEKQKIVKKVLGKVEHASLQFEDIDGGKGWLAKQMPNGYGPVFSIILKKMEFARRLPSKLALFHHATSLGGVESLIEWRTMTDAGVERELLRVSVGVEGWEDLRDDLVSGFAEVLAEVGESEN